jgi:hypothetical protein
LRPDLAIGLRFSENPFRVPRQVRSNWYTEVPVRVRVRVWRNHQKHGTRAAGVKPKKKKSSRNVGFVHASSTRHQPGSRFDHRKNLRKFFLR